MKLPPELDEALRRGTAVLVAGTGCGAMCGQPLWRARLDLLAAALPSARAGEIRGLIQRGSWSGALAAAREALGAQAARAMAGMTSARTDRLPAVLTTLAAGPWRAVITTGFDDTWIRAMAANGERPIVLAAGEPLVAQTQGGRLLIHAFGRATRPESLCLTPADLPDQVAAHGLEGFLRDMARTCTFLYVGFQPGDPDLELAGRVLGPATRERPHFALVNGRGAVGAGIFRERFGLRPMAFGGSLEEGLAALAEAAAEAAGMEAVSELGTAELELLPEDRPDRALPPPLRTETETELRETIREEVERHTEAQRWAEAADGLARLVDLEPEDGARARLLHARALVLRDWLDDRAGAIELLEQALEADPALVPAWDALEPLRRAAGDALALRHRYASALKTLGKTADRDLAVRLWSGLAEVSWRTLGDRATAVAALEAAHTLNPDDEGPERGLAALYLKEGPGASDKAVAAHQALAARTPDDAEPYRVLERLWRADGAPERAVWASAVLAQLGEASDHQAQARDTLRLASSLTAARTLSEPLWECLFHPMEDRVLSTLFLVLGPSLVPLMAEPSGRFPPKGAEEIPAVDPSATRPSRGTAGPVGGGFAPAALAYVAHALQVPQPALFLVDSPRRSVSVRLRGGLYGERPALLLDRGFADDAPETHVLFDLTRAVALLRAPWFLRFGTGVAATLDLGLRAAFALCGANSATGGVRKDVLRLLRHLQEERPDLAQEQVVALASDLAHRPQPPDVQRWLAGIELSAARAALAITGDLDAAVRSVRAEVAQPGPLRPAERVKDLMAFAVSEDHFSVRAALALDAPDSSAALG